MIVAKTSKGKYLTDKGVQIETRVFYAEEKRLVDELKEPTERELIELGKQQHPFYRKELDAKFLQDNLDEIDAWEAKATKDKLIIVEKE